MTISWIHQSSSIYPPVTHESSGKSTQKGHGSDASASRQKREEGTEDPVRSWTWGTCEDQRMRVLWGMQTMQTLDESNPRRLLHRFEPFHVWGGATECSSKKGAGVEGPPSLKFRLSLVLMGKTWRSPSHRSRVEPLPRHERHACATCRVKRLPGVMREFAVCWVYPVTRASGG